MKEGRDQILIERKNWESDFFGIEIFKLEVDLDNFEISEVKDKLSEVSFDFIEFNLDVREIQDAYLFENLGFRLVGSRAEFLTLRKNGDIEKNYEESFDIELRLHNSGDNAILLKLTEQFFSANNSFRSRYLNNYYLGEGNKKVEDYLKTWISNSILDQNSIIAIAEDDKKQMVGYFIYKRNGDYNKLPLYKGILSIVTKEHRGKKLHLKLQDYLIAKIPFEEFYLDNTTQLSNISVIKNHIRSKRKLNLAFLTFILKGN